MKRVLLVCYIVLQLGIVFAQDYPSTAQRLRTQFPGQPEIDFILDSSQGKLLGVEVPNLYNQQEPIRFKGDGKVIIPSGGTELVYTCILEGIPAETQVGISMENKEGFYQSYLLFPDGRAQIWIPLRNGKIQLIRGIWALIVPGDTSVPQFDPAFDGNYSNDGPFIMQISSMRFRIMLNSKVYDSGQVTRSGMALTFTGGRDTTVWNLQNDMSIQTDTNGFAGTWRKQ